MKVNLMNPEANDDAEHIPVERKEVDLLGQALTADERELWELYSRLKSFTARAGLAPCVQTNARMALAILWQAVNDLDLEHEHLDHLGA